MNTIIFEKQLHNAFIRSSCPFTEEECKKIFLEYFKEFQVFTGKEHPPLRTSKIIELLNCIDGGGLFEAYCYPDMIDSYFMTDFPNCDRNIIHFFSGRVRELRFYETCY